jgi:hypothetical protein
MNLGNTGVVLCLAAAMVSGSSYAGSHRKESRPARQKDSGMQTVPVSSKVGDPSHGWRYFSDARAGRAVVISPNGDYYYSQGKGLALVFTARAA